MGKPCTRKIIMPEHLVSRQVHVHCTGPKILLVQHFQSETMKKSSLVHVCSFRCYASRIPPVLNSPEGQKVISKYIFVACFLSAPPPPREKQ